MAQRLADDRANAKLLAQLLNGLPGVTVDVDAAQVHMVFARFDWPNLDELKPWMAERGAIVGEPDGHTLRFLTNDDVDADDCRKLVELLAEFQGR